MGKGKQVCYRCFKRTGSRPAEAAASLHPRVLREARANQAGDDPGDDQHGLTRPLSLMTRQQGRAFYSEKLLPNTTRITACPGALARRPQAAWLLERLLRTPPSPQQPARLPRDTPGPGKPSAWSAVGRPWETRPELEPRQALGERLPRRRFGVTLRRCHRDLARVRHVASGKAGFVTQRPTAVPRTS